MSGTGFEELGPFHEAVFLRRREYISRSIGFAIVGDRLLPVQEHTLKKRLT
jgi:hypothetical protein